MLYFYNIFCFLQLNQMLSPPKKSPNPNPEGPVSFIPVNMSAWKHLSNHSQLCTMAIFNSAWEKQFDGLKHQLGAVSWGGHALLPGCLCLVHSAGLWDRDCPRRGGTGFPAATSWSMAVLSLDSGLVMSFVRVMQAGPDTNPESLSPVRGLGEGHSAVLFSPSVLQAFAHSWGVHRTPVCEDQGSVCALLGAWWGRMEGVTSAVQAGVPRLNTSLVRSTARALGAAVGQWMWPERSCIRAWAAASSVPQVGMSSWLSSGNTHFTYRGMSTTL